MVARYLGVVEAAGSNPVTQTKKSGIVRFPIFILFYTTSPEYTYKISKNSTESENAIGAVFVALLHNFLGGVTQFVAQSVLHPCF